MTEPLSTNFLSDLIEKVATLLGAAGVGAALVAWLNGRAKTDTTKIRKDESVEVARIDQSTTLMESLIERVKDLEAKYTKSMEDLAVEKSKVSEARVDMERALEALRRSKTLACAKSDCPNRVIT